MGVLSWLGFRATNIPPAAVTAEPILEAIRQHTLGQTPEQLWREQPYLRTVVTYLARNVAQLGLHVFEHDGSGGRSRVREGPAAALMRRPNDDQTGYELLQSVVSDLALYDHAYLLVVANADRAAGWEIRTVRPRWIVGVTDKTAYTTGGYIVQFPDRPDRVQVPAENMLVFHGWNPDDEQSGVTPVDALKNVLLEQIEAQAYRNQLWSRGGRVGSYVTRPKDAPKWTNEGRSRFRNALRSAWSREGSSAGGTMLLEDGMELKRVGFSAKEEEFVDASKLALTTVASVYHVNPTMLGLLDNANYSNVKEFRKMLYGDTLGPILAMLEARLNEFLLPMLGVSGQYVEFNIREKLEGSFEEQADLLYRAVGGPYMTRNEARAKMNMPALPGGDEMLMPLNIGQVGGDDEG